MNMDKVIEWTSLSADEGRICAGAPDQGRVVARVGRDGHVPVHHEATVGIRTYEIQ